MDLSEIRDARQIFLDGQLQCRYSLDPAALQLATEGNSISLNFL